MAGMQARQSPCPNRCLDDLGSAFSMGCLGGSVFHGFRGMRQAPKGHRWKGAYTQVVLRAPALGGNFAVWGGLFSFFDCGLAGIRQKEDPINAITSGALTGGLLAVRAGPKAAVTNAVIGGVLLALIEGFSFAIGRFSEPSHQHQAVPGLTSSLTQVGGLGSSPAPPPKNVFANLQPTRTFTTSLDDPTAQYLSLDNEDTSQFRSTSATQSEPPSTTTASTATPSFFSRFLTSAKQQPVYAPAVEFSTDDFSFNDSDDFEDDQH